MKKYFRIEYLPLLFILVVAVAFRIYKLRTAPDWYMDEGEFIRLADYLSKGNFDFLGIRNSMLLIGRPPLFLLVLAGLFKLFGADILVLRSFAVVCSLISTGITYLIARQALGKTTAFYAAFLLAILPEYIFYNRMGFSYNWTSLWILLFVFGLWKYISLQSQNWLVFAALTAGVTFASDYIGIICIIVLFLVIIVSHPKHLPLALIAGIPWLVLILPMFIASPIDVWNDVSFTLLMTGLGGENPVFTFWRMIALYIWTMRDHTLIVLGLLGIVILPEKRLSRVILLLLGGFFVLLLYQRVIVGHYLLNIWPLLIIGLARLVEITLSYFYTNFKTALPNIDFLKRHIVHERWRYVFSSLVTTIMVFLLIYVPIVWILVVDVRGFLIEPLNPTLVLSELFFSEGYITVDDATAIVDKISQDLNENDLVIAPGQIYWMLSNNAVDVRTVAAYEYGGKSLNMPDFDQGRFTVDNSLSNARYAIVDSTWRYWWTVQFPKTATLLSEVTRWPMVMARGDVQVFCNPKYCH